MSRDLEQPASQDFRDQELIFAGWLVKAGCAAFFLIPFALWLLPQELKGQGAGCLLFGGILLIFIGAAWWERTKRDKRPIPDHHFDAPSPIIIDKSQTWRAKTGFRYLEEYKERIVGHEQQIASYDQEARLAYATWQRAKGGTSYIDYSEAVTRLKQVERMRAQLLPALESFYAEADRIERGDVRSDILNFQDALKKDQKDLERIRAELAEAKTCTKGANDSRCDTCRARMNGHPRAIRQLEDNLIKYETTLKDLGDHSYEVLHRAAGVGGNPHVLINTQQDEIKRTAEKITGMNSMPNLKRPPEPEDPRAARARQRKEIEEEIADRQKQLARVKESVKDPYELRRKTNQIESQIIDLEEKWAKL